MANRKTVEFLAEAAYNEICDRASEMVEEAMPDLDPGQRVWIEAGIAAGVTSAIKTFGEAGLFK